MDTNADDRFTEVIHNGITMKTATVTDLQKHFPRLAAWIDEGEVVEITKSGKPCARLMPAATAKPCRLVKPDIMARLKRTWGGRVFCAKEVAEMRAAELKSDAG